MSQILDPLPQSSKDTILCCYVNATSQIQIARITNISNWYFERVVFPGQRLLFETLPQALLEIHTGMMASAILSDTIPCERLCLQEVSHSTNDESSLNETKETVSKDPAELTERESENNFIPLKIAVSA